MRNKEGFTLIELMVVIALIGVVLLLAVPTTRDALTVNDLKKASRRFIGLERQLRVDAVRDQVNYVLVLDVPSGGYFVIADDMTAEKVLEVEKTQTRKFAKDVTVLDVVRRQDEKIKDGKVKIHFGKNGTSSPLVLHLAHNEERMTLAVNPFLGVTAIYDEYKTISVEDGLGRDAAKP
jgi:type II secretion system protein H